jgi:hypothetical protein
MENKIPQIGTKEFNDLASACFGGKPKQETLEEAAERLYPHCGNALREMAKETFINGAKWEKERSYSEEEVIKFGQWLSEFNNLDNETEYVIKELLRRFKNK